MAVKITEIHRVDAAGSRRVFEIYPSEDRVTPVCVHLSHPELADHLLRLDILVRPPAPYMDAPHTHRPDPGSRHRGRPQPNYFTTVGLEETVSAILAGLPREGMPRFEVRERLQPTKY